MKLTGMIAYLNKVPWRIHQLHKVCLQALQLSQKTCSFCTWCIQLLMHWIPCQRTAPCFMSRMSGLGMNCMMCWGKRYTLPCKRSLCDWNGCILDRERLFISLWYICSIKPTRELWVNSSEYNAIEWDALLNGAIWRNVHDEWHTFEYGVMLKSF